MPKLSPIESEFDSTEEAEAYDRWLHAKIERSRADPRPPIPHDEVMKRVRETIARRARAAADLDR